MKFSLGDKVRIENGQQGTINFIGNTSFGPGVWVGLSNIPTKNISYEGRSHEFHGVFFKQADLEMNRIQIIPNSLTDHQGSEPPILEEEAKLNMESLILDKCMLEEEIEMLKGRLAAFEESVLCEIDVPDTVPADNVNLAKALLK